MQAVFKRYEIKYKITLNQKQELLEIMKPYMQIDKYGKTTIQNLYFDTDNYRLIRRSLEKPTYKEKLRLRSYGEVTSDQDVFIELKKKYCSVVYKRRIKLKEKEVMNSFKNKEPLPVKSQIAQEIDYFRHYYGNLTPKLFLSYQREAYYSLDGCDFRITFDDSILYREYNLSLTTTSYGKKILDDGYVLMEIKTTGAIPLWLTKKLTELRIFKTSFSKYGTAYIDILKAQKEGELNYARVI